jgi:uncharacterized protein (DUF1800 family)
MLREVESDRQLEEVLTDFWFNHFNVYIQKGQVRQYLTEYERDTIRPHVLGKFRDLLGATAHSPAMLFYLDNWQSAAPNQTALLNPEMARRLNDPRLPPQQRQLLMQRLDQAKRQQPKGLNENYGRELMELFTLGVVDLNGNDNYTQTDVTQIARCLTGFVISDDAGVFVPGRFDGGSKTLFSGKSYQATGNIGVEDAAGNPLPAAQNVIDILFTHEDSDNQLTLPRFLAKKLWEYFAYPGPSKALLDELTPTFIANGFVVADLLRSIFMHDEFYSDEAKRSSVKNPCEFAFSAIRALGAKTNAKTLGDALEAMGMGLFDPPNVNGWNNGFAWLASGQFLSRLAFGQALAAGRDSTLKITPTRLFDDAATDAGVVVDALLAKLGIAARVPSGARTALVDYFEGATNFTDATVIEKKVRGAIALMLALPEFHIH